jgi:hypothetical protein
MIGLACGVGINFLRSGTNVGEKEQGGAPSQAIYTRSARSFFLARSALPLAAYCNTTVAVQQAMHDVVASRGGCGVHQPGVLIVRGLPFRAELS